MILDSMVSSIIPHNSEIGDIHNWIMGMYIIMNFININ